WTALENRIAADLDSAWDVHGPSLLPAMSVEGGSIAHMAARQVEDAVMAALLGEAPAPARAALIGVAADRGEDGPALHAALERLAREDPRLAPAVARALLGITGQPLPPMVPPAIAPGRIPGLELRSPTDEVAVFRTPGSGPAGAMTGPFLPAAAGIALFVIAGLAGARARSRVGRGLAALLLSVALLTVAEAGARIAGTKLLADSEPLLSFIPQGAAVLSIPPTGETGWKQTAGGSIRAALFPAAPEPGRTRVAFVGASTVHGSHVLVDETFAAVSIATANATLGGAPLEGINLGVGGATSSVIRAAARAALDAGAHVLVFYYGHNEVDQFIRLGRYAGIDASVLQARSLLRQSSLYSAIRGMLPKRPPAAAHPDPTGPPDRAEVAS
ncbi:MAG: hypothetical protein VX000_04260, partial [Myxococcota bacterium]|nr:hypothetical protein [Myxococcota bacterium]